MDDQIAPLSPQLIDADALALDVRWLIRLRWFAVITVAASLCAGQGLDWMEKLVQPMVVVGCLGALNVHWHLQTRAAIASGSRRSPGHWRRQVIVQLHTDLLALTAILHWTGGIENPFSSLYVFPVAIATMLLPLRQAFLVFASSFTLFVGLIACELITENRHRPFVPFNQPDGTDGYDAIVLHPVFLAGVAAARFITLLGTLLFLSMLLTRLRGTEARRRRHEQIALSRERLARVGTMSAGLSHSIRNPLHGALNCISLLRDSTSEDERKTTINLLEEGLNRIETVTHRLMDMTREAPFSPEATDLRDWLVAFLQPFRLRNYVDKEVTITTDLPAIGSPIIDRHRVYECLFNVIANAIDALPRTGGRIHLGAQRITIPFAGVEITVTDNGHGIPQEILARVFDPFFTTKPIGEGTGLGLAIARQEIERHGGEIHVAPGPHGGTRVTIRLPDTPFEGT